MFPRQTFEKQSLLITLPFPKNPNLVVWKGLIDGSISCYCWWKNEETILVRSVSVLSRVPIIITWKRECWPEGGQESFASSLHGSSNNATKRGGSCVSAFNTRFVSLCLPNLIRVAQWEIEKKNWRGRSCTGLIEKRGRNFEGWWEVKVVKRDEKF